MPRVPRVPTVPGARWLSASFGALGTFGTVGEGVMRALTVLCVAVVVAGCSVPRKPLAVVSGEGCWRCKHPITDRKIAAEFVADNGFPQKFRTVHCMSTWIAQQSEEPEGVFYVTDYATGKWIRASRASFVRTIVNRNSMAVDYVAFFNEDEARREAAQANTQIENWEQVLARGRSEPLGGN